LLQNTKELREELVKIIVCMKRLASGEMNPFDTSALEEALALEPEQITVVSMGAVNTVPLLEELTRLGPIDAVLLSDKDFAGADTLATSLTLAEWLKTQDYDLIICGRQSIDGETAQVGPELAQLLGLDICIRVLAVRQTGEKTGSTCRQSGGIRDKATKLLCATRDGVRQMELPAVLTMERSGVLRFPSLWAQKKPVTVLNREMLGLKRENCGSLGSPTQVLETRENQSGRRNCQMIAPGELPEIMRNLGNPEGAQGKERGRTFAGDCDEKLREVWITDDILREEANNIAEKVTLVTVALIEEFCNNVRERQPEVILFPADWESRTVAPQLAAALRTGLCADCTALLVEDGELHMVRPAQGGNLLAKIRCKTKPVMATVRTAAEISKTLVFAVGKGALEQKQEIIKLAETYHACMAASKASVELGEFPYECQVGLTGKSISPRIYVAFGISGAIHHIVGMEHSQTIISVNSDPEAAIFKYADYGVVSSVAEVLKVLELPGM